jgi:hypothetical protein
MINRGNGNEYGSVSCMRADSAQTGLSGFPGVKLTFRKLLRGANLPILLLVAVSIAMAGCGLVGTKASGSPNPTPTPTPTVSVSLKQAPPPSLPVGGTAFVSATVSNDVANAGVDWVPVCSSAPVCGSFSPSHTASGAATIFTAPIGVPSSNIVTVTALSTTDHSKSSAASINIISTVTGVTITQFPPSSYPSGGSLSVAATVAGDSSNAGVTWKATCAGVIGNVDCTSGFNGSTHSAPGAPATFVVPLQSVTYPTIVGSIVTLTAYATADHNYSAFTTFTVTTPISINISQPPPSTVLINTSVSVIAVVTNDPTNSGVTWTILNCDAAPCGSWSANSIVQTKQVASGAAATYIAPPSAVNHVNIQAAATASPTTVLATVQISITAPISVTITQGLLNNAIVQNASAPLVATVSNDSTSEGVDWTVTCGSTGACGSFSPVHTVSGASTTFTAPATVPANKTLTITATSTKDPTKTAAEIVTVSAGILPDSLLKSGQWIMALSGKDANGGPFTLGGAIVSDGVGNITNGILDLVDLGGGAGANNQGTVSVSPAPASTYSIGADGRGKIQLTVNVGNLSTGFGVNSSIVLSVVFVNSNHALLSETDAFGSGTGTLDLQITADLTAFQNRTSGLNGVYSLSLKGAEINGSNPNYYLAGAIGFPSTGTTYTESSYIADQSDHGAITSVALHSVSHTFTNPIPNTFGELTLDSVNLGLPTAFSLDAWLIDAKHFVVTDWRDSFSGTPPVVIIGYLVAQPSSPTLSGTYAFTESGATASPALIPQAAGGIFTCGSTGVMDFTPLGGTPVNNKAVTAACSSPANSDGRELITISGSSPAGISQFAAYPTVDQGLFLIELDGGSAGASGPSGAGVARQQVLTAPVAASAFSGKYASNFLANTPLGLEAFSGQVIPDGVSLLSGTADVNSFNATLPPLGTPSSNAALSGSFTAAPAGRFPLALKITPATGQPAPEFTNINPVCYVLDANTCLLLGLDATAPGTGILELQNTGL